MNDKKLASRLRKKDERAFEEIIMRFTPLVSAVVFNTSKGSLSKEDIEETVTDVFVTLWKNTDKIIDDKLKGYLCRIAKTRALNKMESNFRHTVLNIDDYDVQDNFSIADETEKKDIVQELRGIIREIRQPDKEIIVRYYYYHQTVSKISEVMNINVETVKSKLKRTRGKIKSVLTERGYKL